MAIEQHVGDFVTLRRGTTYQGILVGKPGPALLGLGSIVPGGGFRNDFKTYGGECPEELMLVPGDLFVSLKGATKDGQMIGSIARVPKTVPGGRLTQDTVKLVFRNRDVAFEHYLFWLLRTPDYREYCGGRATGSAVVALSRDDFLGYPVPPLTKFRRRIVNVLEEVDVKLELNRRTNETLEEIARTLFKSWFVDFDPVRAKAEGRQPAGMDAETAALFPSELEDSELGGIPTEWRAGVLADLQADEPYAITSGPFGSKLGRADYVSEGVPVIRGCNLGGGPGEWFSEDGFVYVSESKVHDDLGSCIARPGDVIFTQRGTLGQVGLIPLDSQYTHYIVSQSQMKMTCAAHVPPEYILLYFRQAEAVSRIHANAVAAGVPHINLSFLRSFPIVVPTNRVLRRFREIVRPLQLRMRQGERENRSLSRLRDELLPRLLSGEIDLRHAEHLVESAT